MCAHPRRGPGRLLAGSSGREEQEESQRRASRPPGRDSSRLPGAPASNSGSGGMREGAEEAEGLARAVEGTPHPGAAA